MVAKGTTYRSVKFSGVEATRSRSVGGDCSGAVVTRCRKVDE